MRVLSKNAPLVLGRCRRRTHLLPDEPWRGLLIELVPESHNRTPSLPVNPSAIGISLRPQLPRRCQACAVSSIAENNDSLNGGQAAAGRITGKVSIHLRAKVLTVETQHSCLDMKSAMLCVHAQHGRRCGLPFSVQAKRAFYRLDGF